MDYIDIKELGEINNLMLSDNNNIKVKIRDNFGACVFKVTSLDTNNVFYGIKANDTMIYMMDRDAKNIYEMLKKEFEVNE